MRLGKLKKILKDRNDKLRIADYPDNMTELGLMVFLRTYSRYLPEQGRREVWRETVERTVAWSMSLVDKPSQNEMFDLFDAVYNLHVQVAGRSLWQSGTEVSDKYPLANFNCSHITMDGIEKFGELFYLSMLGAGVGFNVSKEYTEKLPPFRNIDFISGEYEDKHKDLKEHTELKFHGEIAELIIGDSKEGWSEAVTHIMNLYTNPMYREVKDVLVIYDHIRPSGTKLKTFGGYASGHEYFKKMVEKIAKVVNTRVGDKEFSRLEDIDILDICNIIGENVVSGGVRRTAQIGLFEPDQLELVNAKANIYFQDEDGNWGENKDIIHRRLSNNSILYKTKPTFEELGANIEKIRYTGEPAFINAEEATRRFKHFKGLNPCAEILLDDREVCNLTAVDIYLAYKDGKDLDKLFRLATRHAYRVTTLKLELPLWREKLERDRLLGVSINGLMDFYSASGLSPFVLAKTLRGFRARAKEAMEEIANELGLSYSENVTAIKPTGTQSLLGGSSAGLHSQWGEFFIRRIRISSTDPLFLAMKSMGFEMVLDTGSEDTYVVEFPCKSQAKRDVNDIPALEQLEIYKLTMQNYTDQNSSCTIMVGNDEWEDVHNWLFKNWDNFVGLSFLSKTDTVLPLMPYETITEEKYNEMCDNQPFFIPEIVDNYDKHGEDFDLSTADKCSTGACPLR